jgi:hypothetical protein
MIMRMATAALVIGLAGAFVLPAAVAKAEDALSGVRLTQAGDPDVTAPRRPHRALRRVPIYPPREEPYQGVYPRYNPGPNAVRECNATYVQEYRPSGTVIVPRMNCYWRRG